MELHAVLILALAFGLALGPILFAAPPVKALEKFSFLGTNGSPTFFEGIDAASSNLAGSYRVGKAPFTVVAFTTAQGWLGSYPITYSFLWGDGAANVSTQSCISCNALPALGGLGTPGIVGAYHVYNVAGTYNAIINVSDVMGVYRSDTYQVQVYASSATASGWRVFIEGAGLVANLSRQTYLSQPIMAYLYKNGTSTLPTGFTASWYMDTWANMIYSQTFTQAILPGEYFPFAWPGNVPQVITTPGTHQFWIKTSCPGCSGFGANVTSPKMTVVYTSSTIAPAMTATQISGSVANLQPGQSTVLQYRITNPSSFSINWYDQLSLTGGVFIQPEPVLTFAQYGPVINNTVQTYIVQPYVASGTPPAAIDIGAYPFTNLGYIVQPGQTVLVPQEVYYPLTTSTQFSGGMQVSFTPYAAASCVLPTTTSGASCAFGGSPVTATTSITTGGPAPASIETGYGQQVGNGSVVLVGYVNSLGSSTAMQTWFQFVSPNGTTYTTQTQIITSVTTVKYYLTGLPTGNYTLQFFATTSTGLNLIGSIVTFTVGLTFGSNNPASTGESFTQGFLYGVASAAGMPAEFVGLILGIVLMMGALVFLALLQSMFDIELPWFVWAGQMIIVVIVNTLFFLWPSWVDLILVVFEGLIIWSMFSEGGGIGTGGGTSG